MTGPAADGSHPGRIDRDELLAHVDLEMLLDALVGDADQRGRWHCPDRAHPDEHPSVSVRVSDDGVQRWRCWSGGHGGTAIDAAVAARGLDTGEAIRWLAASYANLQPVARRDPTPLAPVGDPDPALATYAQRAATLLWTKAGEPQRAWLGERGLGPEVLRANRVGADPGRRYLPRPKGLPGGWPAVVYPSLSPTGELTYLQARYLDPPANRSKYDNPSARLAANPRLAWTRPVGPPTDGMLVVCEGTADALIAAQAGIASVGVLGAAYPDRRVADGIAAGCRQHPRLSGAELVVCFDADPAGASGSARLVELLAERGISASERRPPDGLDLTTWSALDPRWTDVLPSAHATARVAAAAIDPASPTASPSLVAERSISIGGIG